MADAAGPPAAAFGRVRRWAALVRLTGALALRSWRWLPPTLVTVAVVLVLYATAGGAALEAYPLTVALAVPVTAWLTASAGDADDDPHRWLLVAASSRASVGAARAAVGAAAGAVLGGAATAWPVAVGAVSATGGVVRTLTAGAGAHAAGALAGAAVGTFAHRPLVRRTGASVVVGALGSIAVVLTGLPFLRSLARDDASGVVPAVVAAAALLVLASGASTALGDRIER